DLGLCALRPSRFNAMKSCLKAWEYSMVGSEVLCSAAEPFASGLPRELFPAVEHSARGWRDALAAWLDRYSEAASRETAGAQRDWVAANHGVEAAAGVWESVLTRFA